jgi:urease accessory protein
MNAPDMKTLLLLLLDSRAPAGAQHHSGAMEAAVMAGLVTDLTGAEDFCRTRLRTSARVAAAFAAATCHGAERAGFSALAAELDAEFEARTPSEAARTASRQLGRGLIRLARSVLKGADLGLGAAPHHPLALGAVVSRAGGDPELAARAAALAACAGPASAAVRLLGLDPFAVHAMLARLAPGIDACAADAARCAAQPPAALPATLPADGAPALDLLPDYHLTAEVRLFAS